MSRRARHSFRVFCNSTAELKDGTGNVSTADLEEGLRQLKVFDGMSKEQASLATRRFDQNGDGTVSLCDFLAFAGRPYAANDRPLEAKLRRVLLKAEAVREGCRLVGKGRGGVGWGSHPPN